MKIEAATDEQSPTILDLIKQSQERAERAEAWIGKALPLLRLAHQAEVQIFESKGKPSNASDYRTLITEGESIVGGEK